MYIYLVSSEVLFQYANLYLRPSCYLQAILETAVTPMLTSMRTIELDTERARALLEVAGRIKLIFKGKESRNNDGAPTLFVYEFVCLSWSQFIPGFVQQSLILFSMLLFPCASFSSCASA